jgi:hypothetical protein
MFFAFLRIFIFVFVLFYTNKEEYFIRMYVRMIVRTDRCSVQCHVDV